MKRLLFASMLAVSMCNAADTMPKLQIPVPPSFDPETIRAMAKIYGMTPNQFRRHNEAMRKSVIDINAMMAKPQEDAEAELIDGKEEAKVEAAIEKQPAAMPVTAKKKKKRRRNKKRR